MMLKPFLLASFLLCYATLTSHAQVTIGLLQNDSTSFNGYTLLMPTSSTTTYLIDNCGFVVHTWPSVNFPGLVAYLLEDGTLLRTARVASNVFNAGGIGGLIELIDWDGTVLWSYEYADTTVHQHHDIEPLPNGNVLILAWELKSNFSALSNGRNPALLNGEVWVTEVVEVQPVGTSGGNIVWRWSVWDHLVQDYDNTKANFGIIAGHPELIDFNYTDGVNYIDWVHGNSIEYIEEYDQIMINSRNFGELWIIDHSTSTAEAATHTGGNSGKGGDILYRWGNPRTYDTGRTIDTKLFAAHDASWITQGPDSGKILVFNNGEGRPAGNFSTVEMIIPPVDASGNYTLNTGTAYGPDTVYWNYTAPIPTDFYSQNVSGAQEMPNGNILICEGRPGRVFEVTKAGDMVWEYIIPLQLGSPASQGTTVAGNQNFRAYRFAPDYAGLMGKDLTPGAPIELNPLPSTCIIYIDTVITTDTTVIDTTIIDTGVGIRELDIMVQVQFMPNPVNNELTITNSGTETANIHFFNIQGQLVFETEVTTGNATVTTHDWPAGIYLIKVQTQQAIATTKIIKQ